MEGTRHAGSGPFMPRKPGQREWTAVQSAVWAAYSWQRTLGPPAPDCDYRPRGERHYRPCGDLTFFWGSVWWPRSSRTEALMEVLGDRRLRIPMIVTTDSDDRDHRRAGGRAQTR